jgi:precorrin-2 dehydrogenase/sirohydrochlorin ferrochelatase
VIGDSSRPHYPAFLDLKGHLAVVIGGGPTAERAVLGLLRYQADITVIAPTLTTALEALVVEGIIEHEARDYIRGDLAGAMVAISAGESVEVNRAIYKEAEGSGCLVSVPRDPALSNFITPAVVQRGPFQLAISTAGAAPEVARAVRRDLEGDYGPEWVAYVELLAEVRCMVMERISDAEEQCEPIFNAIAASDVRERIVAGVDIGAEDVFREFVLGADEADASPDSGGTDPKQA